MTLPWTLQCCGGIRYELDKAIPGKNTRELKQTILLRLFEKHQSMAIILEPMAKGLILAGDKDNFKPFENIDLEYLALLDALGTSRADDDTL